MKRISIIFTLLLSQACSGDQIGAKLSKSFSELDESKLKDNKTSVKLKKREGKESLEINKKESSKAKPDLRKSVLINSKAIRTTSEKKLKDKTKRFKPHPYRLILKLSGANPSAPAESVTRELRKAGIDFEVEKIERL